MKRKPVNAGSPSQTTVTGLNAVDTRESTFVIRIASMMMLPMIMSGRAVLSTNIWEGIPSVYGKNTKMDRVT